MKRSKHSRAGLKLRPYQKEMFNDRHSGILVAHWSRQIGKSFTLAAWAVDRCLARLRQAEPWLVTVLSNSRSNGAEFNLRCAEVCRLMKLVAEHEDLSPDTRAENLHYETRLWHRPRQHGPPGRIVILAANPRTARGFSGDLILDEFAHHADSTAIWEAAEPILSARRDYLCRVASTGNGRHNLFYRMASGQAPGEVRNTRGRTFRSVAGLPVSVVTRSAAYAMGIEIYDPVTREPTTPESARAAALDKRAYDQNYECAFEDENTPLLTHELISAAERSPIAIDDQQWSPDSMARMTRAADELFVGMDIGRNRDLSVVTVLERAGNTRRVIGMLRMAGMRGPDQRRQLEAVCRLPKFRRYAGDMTGMGTFFIEELQEIFGTWRIQGVNFSTTEPLSERLLADGRRGETAKVTELMAVDLLGCFEDRSIEIPQDAELRADLVKPEKITSPSGRVSIAATRDEAGHADHFWSLALALRAAVNRPQQPGGAVSISIEGWRAPNLSPIFPRGHFSLRGFPW